MTDGTTPAIAIVSSQRRGEVAVIAADGRVGSEAVRSAGHSEDLLPALDRLCAREGVSPRSLRTVVVDVGPGGFTGLRVGVAAAKFVAEVSGAALVATPSAEVVAAGSEIPPTVRRVLVVLAVKPAASAGIASTHAGTAWCTTLRRREGGWSAGGDGAAPDGLQPLAWIDQWIAAAGPGDAVVGESEFLPAARRMASERTVAWIEPRWSAPAALTLGLAMLARGQRSDPLSLAPIYPRPPEAAVLWERRQAAKDAANG